MNFDDLIYKKKDKAAYLYISRPDRKNALGNDTTQHLIQALSDIEQDTSIKVVVITGSGDAFCAGGDFEDTFNRGANRSEQEWLERIQTGASRLAYQLRSYSKPVIAAVNGVAVGGGATIALACDLRIASTKARFNFPFAKLGLTPEFGCSYLLPRVVGLGNALELLLLTDFIDANEALRIGLVNKVVPEEELSDAVDKIVLRLSEHSLSSLTAIKKLLHQSSYTDFSTSLNDETIELARAFKSPEHREAVKGFIESRTKQRRQTD